MSARGGFSLLELLVVLTILGILVGSSFSVYREQLLRSRRTDAHIGLAQAALRQEEWRLRYHHYAGDVNDLGGHQGQLLSPQGYYALRLNALSSSCIAEEGSFSCYVISAHTRDFQAGDSNCAVLYLNQEGMRGALDAAGNTSIGCW